MPQRKDSNGSALKAAKEYVQKQIATMKAHGAAPKISSSDLKTIIHQVAEASK